MCVACCTRGSDRIVHFTPPATQRASLSRSGELTVASFIKIIDSGHQDSQYLATLTFDATAGAAQDECPASPSPTVVGWMATRMAATPTTVARWMPVPIAVPLAAVGAREKVAPHCVTDLGDYACRRVATRANLRVPFLANGLAPANTANSWALAAVRGVPSYAELLVVPSRSREKVRARLRARKRFFPNNFTRRMTLPRVQHAQ